MREKQCIIFQARFNSWPRNTMTRIEEGLVAPESGPSNYIEPTDDVVMEERIGVIYDEQAPLEPPRSLGKSWEEEHAD